MRASPTRSSSCMASRMTTKASAPVLPLGADLTWVSWTKLCERMSLGKELGYAEEEA
jgi:hypothetical protein